jgi:nitrite reductase/ring-hydroxylating ferredoxin subunit
LPDFVHFVCRTGDVPPGECREFTANGRSVLICESGGEYYAHSAFCSHLRYSLDWSQVSDGCIECPWHRFRYDVVTGANVFPGAMSPLGDPALSKPVAPLQTFETQRRGDAIYVALDSA